MTIRRTETEQTKTTKVMGIRSRRRRRRRVNTEIMAVNTIKGAERYYLGNS